MMQCFVVKIFGMSIASSVIGLMILGIRKINKNMPIKLISMLWLIFFAFLIIPFQFGNITNNIQITQPISEIRERVLTGVEVQSHAAQSVDWWNMVFFVHMIVFVALCLRDICAQAILKYNIKNKKIEPNLKILNLFDATKEKLNFKKKVDLICQDGVLAPATIGILKPKVLISREFLNLSEREQECIFLHELMHIKKFDNVKYFFIHIIKNFYWFNPLINFLTRRIKEDIEILTDKLVVKYVEIKEYLILILKISQFGAASSGAFPAFAADKKILERRIKIVKRERKLSFAVISSFTALVGALVGTGVVFATPPKTTANHPTSSVESAASPSSSNSENSNSNNNSNNVSSNTTNNSNNEEKKYVVKDFETGKILKLSQQEYDEYMKKFKDKGYVDIKVEDPEVAASIEKDLLKDGVSGTTEGCYVKELKWDESKSCYVENK